ncbi:MAG: ATP-binding cassette domain-containing protein, partial [Ruthenibacterium sp.]
METTKTDFLLELTGITKSFPGVKALDRVSLKIRPASVHALMGENGAGKSTLMKCLFGIYSKDSGSILYSGREIDFKSPKEALDNGISMVHQELNQVLEQRVMDNIWLGRVAKKGIFLDEKKMYEDTRRIFEDLGIEINPREKVSRLSVSQRQMIEIAKAVSCNAKIIVFDEPTSSLTEKEVEHLFKIIKTLKEKGCGMIYISHKMEEIFKISDDITIMRDGTWVFTDRAENMSMDQIISLMVGRTL